MRKLFSIVLATLAVVLLAACSGSDAEPTSTPGAAAPTAETDAPTPESTPTPATVPAADIVANAVTAMQKVPSLHFEIESQVTATVQGTSLTIPLKLVADYVAPDQVAGTISATIAFVTFEAQVVAVDDQVYVQDPLSGEWQVTESNPLLTLPVDFLSSDLTTLLLDAIAVEDDLDGVAAHRVSATVPLEQFGGPNATFDLNLWIAVDDSTLRRVTAQGDFDFGSDVDLFEGMTLQQGSVSMSATLSDFGKEVTIVAPDLSPTPEPTAAPAAPVDESPEAAAVRQVALDYWSAYNSYDADAALSYLEDAYRADQEDGIRSNIGLMQGFGAKLTVTEESPPVVGPDGEAEIVVRVQDPLSTRSMRMTLVQIDGEWKISAAEQQ